MARVCIVLGAGATRGASFVRHNSGGCLPPLVSDFFVQLQRISDPTQDALIREVIETVRDISGDPAEANVENVYSAFQSIQELHELAKDAGVKAPQLIRGVKKAQENLEVAIKLCLDRSIANPAGGHWACTNHETLASWLTADDCVINFNYDCLMDSAVLARAPTIFDPSRGYGFVHGTSIGGLNIDPTWANPAAPAAPNPSLRLLKLHGSLHFQLTHPTRGRPTPMSMTLDLVPNPYTGAHSFAVIPPVVKKDYNKGFFAKLWVDAYEELKECESLVIVGYSMAGTDFHSTTLFQRALKAGGLKNLVIADPSVDTRNALVRKLGRFMNSKCRVVGLSGLGELVSLAGHPW